MKRFLLAAVMMALVSGCAEPAPSQVAVVESPTLDPNAQGNEAVLESRELIADWYESLSHYIATRYEWEARLIDISQGYDTWIAGVRPGIDPLLDQLAEMKRTQFRLRSVFETLIEEERVPEIISGQVSDTDLRRYAELTTTYVDLSVVNLSILKDCFSLPTKSEVGRCFNTYITNLDQEGERRVLNELDALQFKLFGQHLNFS